MNELISSAFNIVLPILLGSLVGFGAARAGWVTDSRALSRATLYIFTPALVLTSLARSQLAESELGSLLLFNLIAYILLGALGYGTSRLLRLDPETHGAFLLTVLFANSGNYGIPFCQFAYGEGGLVRAAVFFVVAAVMNQTLGIYLASSGRSSAWQAFLAVLRMPLVYAAVAGVALNRLHLTLPLIIGRPLDLLGAASVPLMLVILGMELASATWGNDRLLVGVASTLKLIVTPVLMFGLAAVLGVQGLARNVGVIEFSMPTAVTTALLAIEFDARPKFVTGVVLLTTVASIITLPVLLLLLK